MYKEYEKPVVSNFYSYENDVVNNRVICSSLGQIKVLNCEPKILEEVLSYTDGLNTFLDIEKFFLDRYSKKEVSDFLNEILKEGLINKSIDTNLTEELAKIIVIGEGSASLAFKEIKKDIIIISTDKFLSTKNNIDFDIAIWVPEHSTYEKMFKINELLCNANKIFIPLIFNDLNINVGPLVIPSKSACLKCDATYQLKRLNNKFATELKLSLEIIKKIKYSCSYKIDTSKLNYIANFILRDIYGFLNNKPSCFLDFQYSFEFNNFLYSKKEMLPTTECDFCNGSAVKYFESLNKIDLFKFLDENDFNVDANLVDRDIKYTVGGIRSKSEEETRKIVDNDLKKLGVSVRIEEALGNPFSDNDVVNCYNSFIEQNNYTEAPYIFRKNEGCGKGLTKTQAYFSAAFELIEHVGLQYTGDIPVLSAKYKDVKEYAIDMKLIAKTIKNTNTSFDKFDENIEIDWVVSKSVDGKNKLIPAFLVFMFDINFKGNLIPSTSNGAASGLTLEDAILHGLFEIIERDAWLIGQSNPYVLPIVDYNSISNPKIKSVINSIEKMGYTILTRDYTNDLGIPTFRTWIVNKKDYSRYAYMGFGCHVYPELALERSITEAVQVEDNEEFGGNFDSDMINLQVLNSSLVNLYNQHFLVNKDILGKTDKITKIVEFNKKFNSSYEIIKYVSKIINEKIGGSIYFVDLSKPYMKTKVVRTVVTGDIQRMNIPLIAVSDRMFEFGKLCGYSDKRTTYEELFMGKYQH
ncbi:MAG: YcaO-like family protein [Defluviitaleaceae bacterium]|nr:YcaO-like family protein [Defluviitaleaceae bacterium]